jgi:hypothetical protein
VLDCTGWRFARADLGTRDADVALPKHPPADVYRLTRSSPRGGCRRGCAQPSVMSGSRRSAHSRAAPRTTT